MALTKVEIKLDPKEVLPQQLRIRLLFELAVKGQEQGIDLMNLTTTETLTYSLELNEVVDADFTVTE